MKKIVLLFTFIVLLSCSNSDDNSNTSSSPYSPPAWIQGTWGLKANGISIFADQAFYKFTEDNVCQITSGISTLCWKETVLQFPTIHSGSDTSSGTIYEANLISGNGAQTLTFKFERVSVTKILWLNASPQLGDFELEKLNQ